MYDLKFWNKDDIFVESFRDFSNEADNRRTDMSDDLQHIVPTCEHLLSSRLSVAATDLFHWATQHGVRYIVVLYTSILQEIIQQVTSCSDEWLTERIFTSTGSLADEKQSVLPTSLTAAYYDFLSCLVQQTLATTLQTSWRPEM